MKSTYNYRLYKELNPCKITLQQGVVGTLHFNLQIPSQMVNDLGFAHNGAIASFMDVLTLIALFAFDQRMTTSAKLTVEYMNPVPVNQPLIAKSTVRKIDNKIAFVECDIIDPETNEIHSKGK